MIKYAYVCDFTWDSQGNDSWDDRETHSYYCVSLMLLKGKMWFDKKKDRWKSLAFYIKF
jgi:hypothetical protein